MQLWSSRHQRGRLLAMGILLASFVAGGTERRTVPVALTSSVGVRLVHGDGDLGKVICDFRSGDRAPRQNSRPMVVRRSRGVVRGPHRPQSNTDGAPLGANLPMVAFAGCDDGWAVRL
jgi:hypothetical protein